MPVGRYVIGRTTSWTAPLAAAWIVLGACCATWAAEKTPDQRFLSGLRQRRLFELAERYCTDRLGDPQLPGPRRAELVVEWSLTLAERAVHSAPDQREPLWQRAVEVTRDFVQKHPDSPRVLVVRLQGALALLARGELARQEGEVAGSAGPALEEARTSLRAAIRLLEALGDEVARQLRERSLPGRRDAGRADPDKLTEHQLIAVQNNIRCQLARAHRNLALCYGPESADRANSLAEAVRLLDPLARLDPAHPLGWTSRIDELVCYRLLADYPTAGQKLDAVLAEKPPASISPRLLAEAIRLALATDGLSQALALCGQRELGGGRSGELDYAILETYLAAWRAASQSDNDREAAQWQAKASETVGLMGREHGPYWRRRAQMLLSRYLQGLPGGDLQMLTQAAESSYLSGQYDDALAAYDRAGALAQEQGNQDEAFRLGFIAATIEHERERHEQAMSRYHALALAAPSQKQAPEAHLLAFYNAGQLARQQAAGALDQYVALGNEHLATWPNAPTADEVRWCMGRLNQLQRSWQEAIRQYQAISPDHPKHFRAVEALGRCYQAWLDRSEASGEPTGEVAAQAAAWFEQLILGPQGQLPELWSPPQRAAALAAARFRLRATPPDFGRAQAFLAAALEGAQDAPADWQSSARTLLVFSLAGQRRHREAAAVLEQISSGPPKPLLAMLEGLSRLSTTAGGDHRAELADLELQVLARLGSRSEQLPQAEQQRIDGIRARALADAGRIDEALQTYEWLSKAYPRDGQIQEGYAQLLLTRQDRASLEAALGKWREVEQGSRPATQRWFRAKLAVAWLHDRLGNPGQADKLLRLLTVLHPEPELRDREATAQFLKLLEPEAKSQFLDLLGRVGE